MKTWKTLIFVYNVKKNRLIQISFFIFTYSCTWRKKKRSIHAFTLIKKADYANLWGIRQKHTIHEQTWWFPLITVRGFQHKVKSKILTFWWNLYSAKRYKCLHIQMKNQNYVFKWRNINNATHLLIGNSIVPRYVPVKFALSLIPYQDLKFC